MRLTPFFSAALRATACAALFLGASSLHAQSVVDTARAKWAELAGRGEQERSRAVQLPAQPETWGDIGAGAPPRALVHERQRADERMLDERGWDDRSAPRHRPAQSPYSTVHRERATQAPAVPAVRGDRAARPVPTAAAAAGRAAGTGSTQEPTLQQRLARLEQLLLAQQGSGPGGPAPAPGRAAQREASADCVNVARVWEGAAALARRGQHERAYEAYLRLLAACTDERELEGSAHQALTHLPAPFHKRLLEEPVLASPRLAGVAYLVGAHLLFAANEAGQEAWALALARELRPEMLARRDADALVVAGWLEQNARQSAQAERLFRAAIAADRHGIAQREGLVVALLAQDKVEQARAEVERVEGENAAALRGEVQLAQARQALTAGEHAQALRLLEQAQRSGVVADAAFLSTRAWALLGTREPQRMREAARVFGQLAQAYPQQTQHRLGQVEAAAALRDATALRELGAQADAVGARARELLAAQLKAQGRRAEAARLSGERVEGLAGGMSAALAVRSKQGEAGQGRLTQVNVPQLNVVQPLGAASRVEVSADLVRVGDGVNNASGTELRARYVSQGPTTVAVGVGLSRVRDIDRITFELLLRRYLDSGGHLEGAVFREPVMDSLRSYAGLLVAPGSGGLLWQGRAMRTGVRGAGALPLTERFSLDWSLSAGAVTSAGSSSNGFFEGRVGLMQDITMPGLAWFALGPQLRFASYGQDHNRFGNVMAGGYFSPRTDMGAGLRFAGSSEEGQRLMYSVSGYMGYASRMFHDHSSAGAQLEAEGSVSYLLTPRLIGHAGLRLRTSPGYVDTSAFLGLSLPFETRSGLNAQDLQRLR
jgi:hypothetical protein